MNKERKCPECRGIIKSGETELIYEFSDFTITIKNVPANVCSKCGQAFVSGRVADEVNRLVNRIVDDINSFTKRQPQIRTGHKEVAIAI